MIARTIATTALLTFVSATQGFAQAPANTDPWKRVPAPTSCYSDDGYEAKLHQAREALSADMEKQTELNATLQKKFDDMDMREKMSRMQAYMMKDPQAAMKMMQAKRMPRRGQNNGLLPTGALKRAGDKARFNSAADAVAKPFQAQRD
jgi:hypothetical protein